MRPFPCISCLEPLPADHRFGLMLAAGVWWHKITPVGSWCRGCATASMMKRNIRLLEMQRKRTSERKK